MRALKPIATIRDGADVRLKTLRFRNGLGAANRVAMRAKATCNYL